MVKWFATGMGAVFGLAFIAAGAAILVSVPWFANAVVRVIANREWVPLSYTLRSLAGRRVATLATFVGIAMVVFVLATMLMLARGIEHTLESTGGSRNAKVVRLNSPAEMNSQLSVEEVKQLSAASEIAKGPDGTPLVGGEMVVLIWLQHQGARTPDEGANVTVRGIHPVGLRVHPPRQVNGRVFAAGTNEVVIGRNLAGRFDGAKPGGSMSFAGRDWQVVGVVDHGGTAYDSEVWGDFEVLAPAFKAGYSVASMTLTSPSALATFNSGLAANPQFAEISAVKESTFWKAVSKNYVEFITLLGGAVGGIFAFAAILGAMNTMYAQVSSRTREIGALRAIGFKRRAILASLMLESMMLSLVAGAVGVFLASLLSGTQFRLTTMESLSEITYGLHLSLGSMLVCLGFAAFMGYAGGLLPALRASTIPIVSAVRTD